MRIFLDVEGAQRVVRQIRETARQHQEKVRYMQRQLQQILSHWQGDAPQQYVIAQEEHLQRIQQYIQELLHLADILEKEINEYLQMDHLDFL